MAGWSLIPQSAGDANWASASGPWAELYAAWNERRAVRGQSAATAPTAGVVIADKDWIEDIQAWVESYCSSFVKASDYSGTSETEYDGASSIIMWDWDSFAATILGGGWKRKGGPGAAIGRQEAGYWASYIELMNQLKDALNALVWTLAGLGTTYIDGSRTHTLYYSDRIKYESGATISYVNWDGAKTAAEGTWAQNSTETQNYPICYSYGSRTASSWSASIRRQGSKFEVRNLPSGVARKMDSFIRVENIGVFDDNSDDILQNLWSFWEGDVSSSGTTSVNTGYISPDYDTIPNWCGEPPIGETSYQGWAYQNCAAILRWNVSGGFQYV